MAFGPGFTLSTVTLALLMVGTFRYRSFKGVDLKRRRRSITVRGIAIVFRLVALEPKVFLLAATSIYTLSGPAGYVLGLVRRRGGDRGCA